MPNNKKGRGWVNQPLTIVRALYFADKHDIPLYSDHWLRIIHSQKKSQHTCWICCLSLLCCWGVRYMLSLAKSPEVGFFLFSFFTIGTNPRLLFKDSRMKSREFDLVELGELIGMLSSPCPHTCTLLLLWSLPVDTFSRLANAAPQSACQKCNVKCSLPRVIGLDICACVLFASTHTSRCNPSVPLFFAWLCRHVVTNFWKLATKRHSRVNCCCCDSNFFNLFVDEVFLFNIFPFFSTRVCRKSFF